MNITHILRMAIIFDRQVKKASLRGNMAKRILFSLLAHLVPIGESARIALTKGVVDYNALKQMIPGARELLEYGIAAALEESMYNTNQDAPHKISALYKANNNKNTLTGLIELFSDYDSWPGAYGGKQWEMIAKTLFAINEHLENSEKAKASGDVETQMSELMQMTSFVNVLDGLAHNTGSIMEKLLDMESLKTEQQKKSENEEEQRNNPDFVSPELSHERLLHRDNEFDKIVRLMDSKELTDPDDILQEILPSIESESDALLTMKDWVNKVRQKRHIYEGTVEGRNKKIEKIREKKKYNAVGASYNINEIKAFLQKLSVTADNRVKEEIMKNRNLFFKMYCFIGVVTNSPFVHENTKKSLLNKAESAHKLSTLAVNSPTKYNEYIADMPDSNLKALLKDCYLGIFEAEKAVDNITIDV